MSTTAKLFPSGPPQLNHVALSVPPDLLDEAGRDAITRFYREVFGWAEMRMLTIDRRELVLSANTFDQFVYITAEDPPMSANREDHFGISVGTLDELNGVAERATAYLERDERVHVSQPTVHEYRTFNLHSIYVRYLLPLMIEVQHIERTRRARDAKEGDARAE
jgi:hypothetical protein